MRDFYRDTAPPHSKEAEKSVLRGMMLGSRAVAAILEIVSEDAFYFEANRRVFRAMLNLFQHGEEIDIITVSERLKRTNEFDTTEGVLKELQTVTSEPIGDLEAHAHIIRDSKVARMLVEAGGQIIRNAYDLDGRDIEELLHDAQEQMRDIMEAHDTLGFSWNKRAIMNAFQAIEDHHGPAKNFTVQTGFEELDKLIGGFQPGELVIVAARPNMGKTAIALDILRHNTVERQIGGALCSLESTQDKINIRLLCAIASVDSMSIRTGQLSSDEWGRIATASGKIQNAPIYMDFTVPMQLWKLAGRSRNLKARHPDLKFIIIDHIQLLGREGKKIWNWRGPEFRPNEEVTQFLKSIAKELEVTVIALSQLKPSVEKRKDPRPRISDLYGRGEVEANADIIIFPYRPEHYMKPEEAKERDVVGKAEAIVAKSRDGRTGSVNLHFTSQFVRFENQ